MKGLTPALYAYALSILVAGLAVVAWGGQRNIAAGGLSVYALFPLLGLLAFSLMWAHYIVAAVRSYKGVPREAVSRYFEITSFMVLFLILLHPGLLIWQLWRDGYGLPPSSYTDNYVQSGKAWLVMLGSISLVIFLLYELRRYFSGRSWWRYVQYLSDIAIIMVYFHALGLGAELFAGWYRAVWYVYGLVLAGALVYLHVYVYDTWFSRLFKQNSAALHDKPKE